MVAWNYCSRTLRPGCEYREVRKIASYKIKTVYEQTNFEWRINPGDHQFGSLKPACQGFIDNRIKRISEGKKQDGPRNNRYSDKTI